MVHGASEATEMGSTGGHKLPSGKEPTHFVELELPPTFLEPSFLLSSRAPEASQNFNPISL